MWSTQLSILHWSIYIYIILYIIDATTEIYSTKNCLARICQFGWILEVLRRQFELSIALAGFTFTTAIQLLVSTGFLRLFSFKNPGDTWRLWSAHWDLCSRRRCEVRGVFGTNIKKSSFLGDGYTPKKHVKRIRTWDAGPQKSWKVLSFREGLSKPV